NQNQSSTCEYGFIVMKIKLFTCADSCLIDANTNRVSLLNLCEELRAESFPAVHAQLVVLSIFERNEGEPQTAEARLTVALNANVMADAKVNVDFKDGLRCRNMATFSGLPLMSPGELTFELKLGRQTAMWKTTVSIVTPPKIAAPVKQSGAVTESSVRPRKSGKKASRKR